MMQKVLGPESSTTLSSMQNLAQTFWEQERHVKAEALQWQVRNCLLLSHAKIH